MQACLRSLGLVFEVVTVIALLLRDGRRGAVEITRDHVGKNGVRL